MAHNGPIDAYSVTIKTIWVGKNGSNASERVKRSIRRQKTDQNFGLSIYRTIYRIDYRGYLKNNHLSTYSVTKYKTNLRIIYRASRKLVSIKAIYSIAWDYFPNKLFECNFYHRASFKLLVSLFHPNRHLLNAHLIFGPEHKTHSCWERGGYE